MPQATLSRRGSLRIVRPYTRAAAIRRFYRHFWAIPHRARYYRNLAAAYQRGRTRSILSGRRQRHVPRLATLAAHRLFY